MLVLYLRLLQTHDGMPVPLSHLPATELRAIKGSPGQAHPVQIHRPRHNLLLQAMRLPDVRPLPAKSKSAGSEGKMGYHDGNT